MAIGLDEFESEISDITKLIEDFESVVTKLLKHFHIKSIISPRFGTNAKVQYTSSWPK